LDESLQELLTPLGSPIFPYPIDLSSDFDSSSDEFFRKLDEEGNKQKRDKK